MGISYANCLRSGEIIISKIRYVEGYILFAVGSADELEAKISARARLAHDGETWLVPGLPEANTDTEAIAALEAFQDRMAAPLA